MARSLSQRYISDSAGERKRRVTLTAFDVGQKISRVDGGWGIPNHSQVWGKRRGPERARRPHIGIWGPGTCHTHFFRVPTRKIVRPLSEVWPTRPLANNIEMV